MLKIDMLRYENTDDGIGMGEANEKRVRTPEQLEEEILSQLSKDGNELGVLEILLDVNETESRNFTRAIDNLKGKQKIEEKFGHVRPKRGQARNTQRRTDGYSVQRRFDRRSPDQRRNYKG
jgi:hypothetical protein